MCPNLCYPIKDCAIFNNYYETGVNKILKFTRICLIIPEPGRHIKNINLIDYDDK